MTLTVNHEISNRIHSEIQSRIHPICSLAENAFIKREDETGWGVHGTKKRKYQGLLKYINKNKNIHLVIIGTENSNNVFSLSQLVKENKIEHTFFLLKDNSTSLTGKITQKILNPDYIVWIQRENWANVYEIANNYILNQNIQNPILLPEGGFHHLAAFGAYELADDVIRNEIQGGHNFSDIIIDAGSGLSAAAMAFRFYELKSNKNIHIVSLAEPIESLQNIFRQVFIDFSLKNERASCSENDYLKYKENYLNFYRPSTSKSFGSVNSTLLQFIDDFMKTEGVILDPIYSGKCFHTAKEEIIPLILRQPRPTDSKILIIHSGGNLSLFGFL